MGPGPDPLGKRRAVPLPSVRAGMVPPRCLLCPATRFVPHFFFFPPGRRETLRLTWTCWPPAWLLQLPSLGSGSSACGCAGPARSRLALYWAVLDPRLGDAWPSTHAQPRTQ